MKPTLPEEVKINPNTLHEGEQGTGMQNAKVTQGVIF